MAKRTTINLDMELIAQAREVLEAGNTTDTVHAALRDVVRRDRLRRLSQRKWDFTLEDLKEMRRSRIETKPWGKLLEESGDPQPSPSRTNDASTPVDTSVPSDVQAQLMDHWRRFGPNHGAIVPLTSWDDDGTTWDDGATIWPA